MAGIPSFVILRAKELLNEFMKDEKNTKLEVKDSKIDTKQVELFNMKDEEIKEIKKMDVNELTPIEALNILNKIKRKIK